MRNAVFMFAFFCLVSLAGCASPPSDAEILQAQIGMAPDPGTAQVTVRLVFKELLRDYDSARIETGPVNRGYYFDGPFEKTVIAWEVVARVNAKNAFGAYTGWQRYEFFWRDGRIVNVKEPR